MKLLGVFLDGLGVENLAIVLADVQVLIIMLRKDDLLLVVPQLQVCCVILLLFGDFLASRLLLLTLLLLLLQLLRGLLRLSRQVSGADLSAQDLCLSPVADLNAECDLCENEFGLLSSVHRSESLNLKLAEDVCRRLEVALLLLDIGQSLGHARALDLDKDLSLGDRPQCLDNGELGFEIRGRVEEAHDRLDHLRDSLLELSMLLRENQDLLIHQAPVSGILGDVDNGDEYTRCRCEI